MANILILKMGSAMPSLIRRRGDFEDYVAAGMGLPIEDCTVVTPFLGETLPDPSMYSGIVLTGSDAMVTEQCDWSVTTRDWLSSALSCDTRILGICYGHQLLAEALGGKVDWNPNGLEVGTVSVSLTREGRHLPLFSGLPDDLVVQCYHSQSVLQLPERARLLCQNDHDKVQGFVWEERAWGIQFHPEFDAGIMQSYLEADRAELRGKGLDPEGLLEQCRESRHGQALLNNFYRLVCT